MPVVNNIAALSAYVDRQNSKIFNANTSSVRSLVMKTASDKVHSEVYSHPSSTPRTGFLADYWDSENDGSLVAIYNYRTENGRDIANIVETGQGYNMASRYEGVPRPFIEEAFRELQGSRAIMNAYKRDLSSALAGGMRVV